MVQLIRDLLVALILFKPVMPSTLILRYNFKPRSCAIAFGENLYVYISTFFMVCFRNLRPTEKSLSCSVHSALCFDMKLYMLHSILFYLYHFS